MFQFNCKIKNLSKNFENFLKIFYLSLPLDWKFWKIRSSLGARSLSFPYTLIFNILLYENFKRISLIFTQNCKDVLRNWKDFAKRDFITFWFSVQIYVTFSNRRWALPQDPFSGTSSKPAPDGSWPSEKFPRDLL